MSFDHHGPGPPEHVWLAALRTLPAIDLPSDIRDLVVFAAHPDDETLGAGGLIATAAAAGRRVRVLVATDGEASHPRSRTHPPDQLAGIRRREAVRAMSALGQSVELTFAGLPDGALAAHRDELAGALHNLTREPCLLVAPWQQDGHPDHEACADVAEDVPRCDVRLWEYPVWAWHWGDPATVPLASMSRLPLRQVIREAKRAALACYASQHQPLSPADGDEAILSDSMISHFQRDFEIFQPISRASSTAYFDELYRASDDPWGLGDRFYEIRKREVLLASLPRRRFSNAFEPGCASGLLTQRLSERCRTVLALDSSQRAVELARARVADGGITIERGRIPEDWPHQTFDLIVLSEIGYYCRDLQQLVALIDGSLTADGVVVACHWRHPAPDHPHSAEHVHDALRQHFVSTMTHLERDFLLELFSRGDRSVAQAAGIAP